jgi:hypothetical protein
VFGILAARQHHAARLIRGWRRGRGFGRGGNRERRTREAGHVGAMLAAQFLACHQRANHAVQPEEERLAQSKSGGDIHAVDGEQVGELDFARMFGGVLVEARSIGFEQCAGIGGELGIFPLRRAARVDQVVGVIDLRAFLARDRAITSACHRDHILQREEIILGMGDGDAISGVGIGLAVDMRHAEFVADDLGRIGPAGSRVGRAGKERLPRRKHRRCQQQHTHQRKRAALDPDHVRFLSQILCGLHRLALERGQGSRGLLPWRVIEPTYSGNTPARDICPWGLVLPMCNTISRW